MNKKANLPQNKPDKKVNRNIKSAITFSDQETKVGARAVQTQLRENSRIAQTAQRRLLGNQIGSIYGNRHLQQVVAQSSISLKMVQRYDEGADYQLDTNSDSGVLEDIVEKFLEELADKALPGFSWVRMACEIGGEIIHGFGEDFMRYVENIRRRERPTTHTKWSRVYLSRGVSRLTNIPGLIFESIRKRFLPTAKDELEKWAIGKLADKLAGTLMTDDDAVRGAIHELKQDLKEAFTKSVLKRALEEGLDDAKVRQVLESYWNEIGL